MRIDWLLGGNPQRSCGHTATPEVRLSFDKQTSRWIRRHLRADQAEYAQLQVLGVFVKRLTGWSLGLVASYPFGKQLCRHGYANS